MTTDPTRAQADEALTDLFLKAMEWGRDQWAAFSMRGDGHREVAEQFADQATALRQRLAADAQPLEAKRYYDGNGNRRGPRLSELRECSPPAQSEGSRG